MELSNFTEKLNKVDGNIYVIEEEVLLENGVYEAQLKHDNVNEATLSVYTGKKLTGEKIETYTLSTPSLTPWKRIIRVHADAPSVFISYETEGDTVEAEDANLLQDAVVRTQEELNLETERAELEEKKVAEQCSEEAKRAKAAEEELNAGIKEETERAEAAEADILIQLAGETNRAQGEEAEIKLNILSETERAQSAEVLLSGLISDETDRARLAEDELMGLVSEETDRARLAENELTELVSEETDRATRVEDEIKNEIGIHRQIWEDKYTRSEVDNKFSILETAIDWKEAVDSFQNLAEAYPNPEDGWTVNVKDTDYTYRWNGTEWTAISANSIPIATQELNGLLSKEDKRLYDEAGSKKHVHENMSALNQVSQAQLDKLHGIADGAQANVQPDWNVTDERSDAFIKNKPAGLPASGGNANTVNGHSVYADVPAGAKFTDTVYTSFQGAAAGTAGNSGLVPAPAAGQQDGFLKGDGTWQIPGAGDFVRKGTTWKDLMGV